MSFLHFISQPEIQRAILTIIFSVMAVALAAIAVRQRPEESLGTYIAGIIVIGLAMLFSIQH
jgi:hypothetical protein